MFWILQLAGWSLFYVGAILSKVGVLPFPYVLVREGLTVVLGIALTSAWRPLHHWLFARRTPLWALFVIAVGLAYLGSFVWNLTYAELYFAYITPAFGRPESVEPDPIGRLFLYSLYNAPFLLAWSAFYFGIKYYERVAHAESQAHLAQLRALRYQLNPHFLFNTLNGISTLVLEERKQEAAAMIARLSDFLRLTLEGTQAATVPLADELDYARRYLDIEQIRFGERLSVRYDVADDLLSAPVPTLLLQPIVENAIKHGIANNEAAGCILIEAKPADGMLLLRVSDNGGGVVLDSLSNGAGIGLKNTAARLRQMYGDGDWLKLDDIPAGGTRVSIRIPLTSR